MYSSVIIAAIGIVTTCTASVLKRSTGTCNSPEFSAVSTVGSTAGTPFCESNWGSSYLPVTNLTVYAGPTNISGIQVTYSDGSQSAVIGQANKYQVETIGVDYVNNIGWSNVTLYAASGDAYLRHLTVRTTSGSNIDSGPDITFDPSVTRFDQDVGSRILYGINGTIASDGTLSSLGFLFLASPVVTLRIEKLEFPNGPIGTSDRIATSDIGTAHFYNNAKLGDPSQTYTFENSLARMQSWSFSQAIAVAFDVEEAVKADFMFTFLSVFSVTVGSTTTFKWTETTTDTTELTISETTTVGYNAEVTLAPGQGVDCVAVAGVGSGTFPYISTVTITLKNGNMYTFQENGYVTVSSVSQGSVECSESNHP